MNAKLRTDGRLWARVVARATPLTLFLIVFGLINFHQSARAQRRPASQYTPRRNYPQQNQPYPRNAQPQRVAQQPAAQQPSAQRSAPQRPAPQQSPPQQPPAAAPAQQQAPAAQQPEATAQPTPEAATTDAVTAAPAVEPQRLTTEAVLEEKNSALQAAGEDAALIEAISTEYQTAVAQLNKRDEFERQAEESKKRREGLAEQVAAVRAQLSAQREGSATEQTETPATLEALDTERVSRKKNLDDLNAALEATNGEIESALGDRADATARLATLETNLQDVEKLLAADPLADESPLVTQARKTRLQTTKAVIGAEKKAKQASIEFIDARSESNILVLRRDLLTQQVQQAQTDLRNIQTAIEQKKAQADAVALSQARQTETQVDPNLRALAKANTELLEDKKSLARRIRDAQAERTRISEALEDLKLRFSTAEEREDLVGLPASVGAALRKQRMDLLNLRRERQAVAERQQQITGTQLKIIDRDEERKRLADIKREAQRYVSSLPDAKSFKSGYREKLLAGAETHLTERRQILDELRGEQNALFNTLTETSVDHEQLIKTTQKFADYIDKRVLWIRSAEPMSFDLRSDQGFRWASADPWRTIGHDLTQDAKAHWPRYASGVLLFFVLTFFAARSRKLLVTLGEEARRSTCRRFLPTARAAFLSAVTALRNVFPLMFIAWRLRTADAQDNSLALATALTVAVRVALPLELLRQVVRRDGLADAHFGWSDRTVTLLRMHLRWLAPVATILVGTASLLASDDGARGPTNIERLSFVVAAGFVSLFAYRVAHPKRGVPAHFLAEYPDGWLARLQPIWFGLIVITPLSVAVLSAFGYVYTANELAWRAFSTVSVIASTAVLYSLGARALLVNRRAAYIDQARQRYRAEAEAAEQASEDGAPPEPLITELAQNQDPLADLRAQTAQARRLMAAFFFGIGSITLWFIWRDVLPAVSDKFVLWHSMRGDESDPITLFELLVAMFVFAISLIAARDLPGLAEIAVLNRLPLEKSVRYAITTLVSYGIVLTGLIVACNFVGLRWRQIQWMATALTLGLGFGLQEMFANFVAGIIILFERPVRVGDIVTLGDITGVVSRVRIRATTITNWDRKDYIVPNKDFITGRVLNWTLSDHVNRIVVNVGIAYGSDTQLAKQLVYGVAKKHPIVVDDPEPLVTFEAFGASSLDFVLRCYISMKDMPMRLQVVDELHTEIDNEFRKAGIEIAFPQQDLHIRDLPASMLQSPRRPEEAKE